MESIYALNVQPATRLLRMPAVAPLSSCRSPWVGRSVNINLALSTAGSASAAWTESSATTGGRSVAAVRVRNAISPAIGMSPTGHAGQARWYTRTHYSVVICTSHVHLKFSSSTGSWCCSIAVGNFTHKMVNICCQQSTFAVVSMLKKKLSYRRGTARCVVSVEIWPIATQQCKNYLFDKSRTMRSYEVVRFCGHNV